MKKSDTLNIILVIIRVTEVCQLSFFFGLGCWIERLNSYLTVTAFFIFRFQKMDVAK